MHIKSIKLQTFKRFSDLSIVDLPVSTRMVIVAGPNGNGKSSLFDAFNAFHHRSLSSLGYDWQPDYHVKKMDSPPSSDGTINIDFFEALPTDRTDKRKAFYVRSAYRNDPDFQTHGLQQMGAAVDIRRLNYLTDNDAAVSDNYRRIASRAVSELYDSSKIAKTYGDFQRETLDDLNKYLNRLWPSLSLTSLGAPLQDGSFFFTKGVSKNFRYRNLSGGEKACFDIILDLLVKAKEFDNTVFVIDEPETHVNPRLHGELFRILFELIPENCQMWLGTHAIGMMRPLATFQLKSQPRLYFWTLTPISMRHKQFVLLFFQGSFGKNHLQSPSMISPLS